MTTTRVEDPVFDFDHPHEPPARELADLLGGKGAGLAEMTSALGLPVPPGFTVSLPLCRAYREGGWPDGLDALLGTHRRTLEDRIGRRFGDPADPLLLAVRSGAPRSMPGMLDTVLNLGLNPETVAGLATVTGDAAFAWESYRRFLTMYATTVLGAPAEVLDGAPGGYGPADRRDADALRAEVDAIRRALTGAGLTVPDDPATQLRDAVEAVFRSWDSPRARAYRAHEGISEDLGTAVNVQAMVFGHLDDSSGTGVVFTRDPSTGRAGPYGDFLPRAQGEDVVSGTAATMPIASMGAVLPDAYAELRGHLDRLEAHYRDLCDVEFTVERGRLWILQTRVGKRGAVAAVRAAVAMVADPAIALGHDEAVARVPADVRDRARAEVLAAGRDAAGPAGVVATGLGASPGRATGAVVLSADAAADSDGDVVLVRPETSPEDVHGMSVAAGILTSTGGLVSHAAVVARGWGLPAVVGAASLTVGPDDVRDAGGTRLFGPGDVITIDGTTGAVWLGAGTPGGDPGDGPGGTAETDDDVLARLLPELAVLQGWADGGG
ncbi:pyruvate,orthophosphate dikinase [Pseudonocardia sediminis]|uniref:Pyruvate,orthophosphate dikinase n=1 Tax=Pseudonocardia sediminis TaxID=1397368 RepID=A0A4Q7V484_PSEST|nr:PEP/pyruvate-binding domain-containing protein [Pseudonocardia sediminis]RZT88458.1 pyruvate,orthophosphate dikinase [Pseudonocardia sediminis]